MVIGVSMVWRQGPAGSNLVMPVAYDWFRFISDRREQGVIEMGNNRQEAKHQRRYFASQRHHETSTKMRLEGKGFAVIICIMTQISKRKPRTPKEAVGCCGPIDDLLDAEMFKGLSDPTRLQLFGCLAKCRRPCTVSELAECCSVDLSVVSRHLALLERNGIVESTKQGRTVYYSVKYAELIHKLRALADALASYSPLSARFAGMKECCAQR